jgi:UDP-glucose 4-epimerase
MSGALFWIVGSGGFLGSHLRRALYQRFPQVRLWDSTPSRFRWTDSKQLPEQLISAVAAFAGAVREHGDSWALLWCAGTGAVTSSAAELEPERSAWVQMLHLLGQQLSGRIPGSIFLASSAGGVYGGSLDELLTEHTPPHPVSDYGKHKLHMEEALRDWAAMFPNVSCLIGRISSLYGPGQNLQKNQGIVSHLSRCLIYRRSVNVYVPLDTRRDYFFVDDCAQHVAASLIRSIAERPQVLVKIFASEELTSLARIFGLFFRLTKRRPLIVSQQTRVPTQARSLKLRSDVWRDMKAMRKTDLAVGIHLVHEHQLELFRHGLLPPP